VSYPSVLACGLIALLWVIIYPLGWCIDISERVKRIEDKLKAYNK